MLLSNLLDRLHFQRLMIVLSSVGSCLEVLLQLLCLTICVYLLFHACLFPPHSHAEVDRMSEAEYGKEGELLSQSGTYLGLAAKLWMAFWARHAN